MSIIQNIQTARERGASDDVILQEVLKQNPEKQSVFSQAQQRGASPSVVLDEILKQNQKEDRGRLQQFGAGVAKDVIGAVRGMSSFGEKVLQAPLKAVGVGFSDKTSAEQLISQERITPDTAWEKGGAVTSAIAQYLAPSSAIMKVSRLLQSSKLAQSMKDGGKLLDITRTAFTRGLPEAGGMAGVATLRGEDSSEIKTAAGFGFGTPVVFKGLSTIAPNMSKLKEITTGVPAKIFDRVKQRPQVYDEALKLVDETNKPFQVLAETVGASINKIKLDARTAFESSKIGAMQKYAKNSFNLKDKVPAINESLKDFNLAIKKLNGKFKVTPTTKTSPFMVGGRPTPELKQVMDITDKMLSGKLGVDDLLDLQKSIRSSLDKAYSSNDSKMISLLGRLTKDTTKFINELIPEMKAANEMYSAYYRAISNGMGKRIVDGTGIIKPNAESFLSNIANTNKGITQKNIAELEKITGIPILDNVVILKDAQKLNNLFPATGSRTLDILRSLSVKAIGGAGAISGAVGNIGAAVAAAGAVAASSPKLVARQTIATAKALEKMVGMRIPPEVRSLFDRIFGKDIKMNYKGDKLISVDRLKDIQPGLSIKDVSKSTPLKSVDDLPGKTKLKRLSDDELGDIVGRWERELMDEGIKVSDSLSADFGDDVATILDGVTTKEEALKRLNDYFAEDIKTLVEQRNRLNKK